MRFLNDLSVRVKVLTISMLLLPALIGVSWLANHGMIIQGVALSRANDIALNKLALIERFVFSSEQVQSDVFRISVLRSMNLPPEEREPVQARLEQGLSDLNVIYGEMLVRWELDATERTILERMKAPMDAFRSQAQQAALVVRDNPSYGVLLVRSTAAAYAEFRRTLTELQDYQAEKIIRIAADSDREARTIRTTIVALAALISLAASLAAVLLGVRLISAPIASVTALMRRLAEGDLSVAVAGRQRRDEIGDMARAVEVFRDNAIRKAQVDEELRATEEHYRLLFTQMLNGFALHEIICDENGKPVDYRFVEANEAFQKQTGLPASQIVGKTARQIFPGTEQYWIETYGQVALTGQPVVFERYARDLDRYFSVSAYCPKPGQFATIIEDITERKRVEQALGKAKEFGEAILNSIQDSICIIDVHDFRIVDTNEAFLRTNVVKREEVIGRHCYELTYGRSTPCAGADETCPIQNMLSSRKHSTVEHIRHAAGSRPVYVEVSAYPILNSQGETVQAVHVTRDISEHKQAEEERRGLELQVQQSQKFESLGVLAGGIAHDFNNLLMIILGNTDIALKRLSPGSPARPHLEAIEKASQRAASLTNQMLAYTGRGVFQIMKIDLRKTVEEMAHLLEASISKNVHLEMILAHGLPPIEADVAQIQQVVMNLITNASEAIGKDAVGEVVMETGVMECDDEYLRLSRLPEKCPPGRYVFLRVRDSGSGMEEETKVKLFDPFYSTKFAGRGLSLAAMLGIVRVYRGAILVESELGKGSTFTVLFPALEEKLEKSESGGRPKGGGSLQGTR